MEMPCIFGSASASRTRSATSACVDSRALAGLQVKYPCCAPGRPAIDSAIAQLQIVIAAPAAQRHDVRRPAQRFLDQAGWNLDQATNRVRLAAGLLQSLHDLSIAYDHPGLGEDLYRASVNALDFVSR